MLARNPRSGTNRKNSLSPSKRNSPAKIVTASVLLLAMQVQASKELIRKLGWSAENQVKNDWLQGDAWILSNFIVPTRTSGGSHWPSERGLSLPGQIDFSNRLFCIDKLFIEYFISDLPISDFCRWIRFKTISCSRNF